MKKTIFLVAIVTIVIIFSAVLAIYTNQNPSIFTNNSSSGTSSTNSNMPEDQLNAGNLSLIDGSIQKEYANIFINEDGTNQKIPDNFLGFNPPEKFWESNVETYTSFIPDNSKLTNIDGEYAFEGGLLRYPVGCSSKLFNPYTSEYSVKNKNVVTGLSVRNALLLAKSKGMDLIYVVNTSTPDAITRSSCGHEVGVFPSYEDRINYIVNDYLLLREELGMPDTAYFHIGNEEYAVMDKGNDDITKGELRENNFQIYFDLAKRFTLDIRAAYSSRMIKTNIVWIAPSSNSPDDQTITGWFGKLNTTLATCQTDGYCPDAYSVQTYPNVTEDLENIVDGKLTPAFYDVSLDFMNALMIKEQSGLRINGFNEYANLNGFPKAITEFNVMCERNHLFNTFYQASMLSNYVLEMMKGEEVKFVNFFQLNYAQDTSIDGCTQPLNEDGTTKSTYADLELFKIISVLKGNVLLNSTDNNRFTYSLPETRSCEDHFSAGRYNYECVRGEYLVDNSYLNHIATYNQELGTLDIIINNISKSPMFISISPNGYTIQEGVETTLISLIENSSQEVTVSNTNPKLYQPGFGLNISPRSINLLRIPVEQLVTAGSNLEIFAKGDAVSGVKPKFSVLINDQVVGAFDVEKDLHSYTLKLNQPLSESDKISVRFLNDLYFQPSTIWGGPYDRNIEFTKMIVDGKEIKVSDPGVIVNGRYDGSTCARTESPSDGSIHCGYANNEDGGIIFRDPSKIAFTLSGLDTINSEGSKFNIYLNNFVIASGETNKDVRRGEFDTYTLNLNRKLSYTDKIKIEFINDYYFEGKDRNLSVKSFEYSNFTSTSLIDLYNPATSFVGARIIVSKPSGTCEEQIIQGQSTYNCESTLDSNGFIEFSNFLN